MSAPAAITPGELNRASLGRQLLLRREPLGVADAVRRVVAVQAQEPPSPYLALWNRLADFDPAELDAAFADFTVVKATLLRVTLHAVHVDDHRVFREAMEPTVRGSRLDHRYTATGRTLDDADAMVPKLLDVAHRPRTTAEIETFLAELFGAPVQPGLRRAWRGYPPLLHVPSGGPWSFGPRPSYVAPRTRPTLGEEPAAASLPTLIRRYLEGFGPASVPDVAQFAMVHRSRVKAAVAGMADTLERLDGPGGVVLYDVPGAPRPAADTPAPPRLLPMWDSILLAYADRSRVVPPAYRRRVTRANGDVLPTLLVDGQVAGVWRPVAAGVEATAFHRLPAATWRGLATEARALSAFLAERDTDIYRRYHHWWTDLHGAETRLLPG